MSNNNNKIQLKYKCNHPESDFIDNSKGPIEMKKENFIEYTRRNETSNYQNETWNSSTSYSSNKTNYSNNKHYNSYSTNNKKSSGGIFWIIILIWFLPGILSLFFGFLAEIMN